MQAKLLRDGHIVDDDWRPADGVTLEDTRPDKAAGVIVPFERWMSERDAWLARGGRLGVVLLPANKVEQLAPDLSRLDLIGAQFPGPSDGRGYTQGRLLRERYNFHGELRAMGYVRRDQLFFLARCGFNSFELPDNELATAHTAFSTFSAEYQPSNDEGGLKLQHR